MRNIRVRRRFKALLILLLIVSFIAFFESRIEAFAPQFKGMAEGKIEDAFGRKMDIAIGTLEGGVVRPFVLRDIQIVGKDQKASSGLVEINSIVSNYRIWNFIFPNLPVRAPYVAVDFFTKNHELSGFIIIEGAIDNASVKGHIRLFGGNRIDITGKVKNGLAHIILMPKEGLVKIECNFAADGILLLKVTVNHFRMHNFDIAGSLSIKNVTAKNTLDAKRDSIEGELEAKNLILNYKPFNDIKASYRISNQTLELSNLDVGKICYINGKFGLREPYMVDALAVTDNVNLSQTLSIFNPRYGTFTDGIMNSKWEFKGPIRNLKSKIRLEIKKGKIGDMNFEYLGATLKGDGPIMTIDDSRITRESGSFVLAGYMDLRYIGKDILFENLKIVDGKNTILWDDWSTAKWQDVREFRMQKKVMGDIGIGFKQFINDDKVDESIRDRDEYELSYNLHPTDSIKVKFSDNKNFIGLEHKDKF